MLGITKRGADGFGSTGGITKVDCNELEKKAAAAQNDELEITEERATMMTHDGKIIIDEKI